MNFRDYAPDLESSEKFSIVLILIVLFLVPWFVKPSQIVFHMLTMFTYLGIIGASWAFLYGTGQFSFGHAGFIGVGGYVSAILNYHFNLAPILGLFAGAFAAAAAGLAIGLLCLRLKGVFLALFTFAFAGSFHLIVLMWHDVTRGVLGLVNLDSFFGISSSLHWYWWGLLLLIITVGILTILWNSSLGLAMKAVRDDQELAESSGISLLKTKLIAFVICTFFAGLGGSFWAHYLSVISPSLITVGTTFQAITVAAIGGVYTVYGAAFGGFIFAMLFLLLRGITDLYYLIFGVILVIVILRYPEGLSPLYQKIRSLIS